MLSGRNDVEYKRTAVDNLIDRWVHCSSHETEEAEDDEPSEDTGEVVCQRYDQRISVHTVG